MIAQDIIQKKVYVIVAENISSKPFRKFNPNKKARPTIASNVNDDAEI